MRDGLAAPALRRQNARDAAHQAPSFADSERSFLVTGGTGLIGRKVVRALLDGGHRVTVLTRQARAAAWLFDGRVECITGMGELAHTRRINVVINLAGAKVLGWRWTPARRAALRKSRVALTEQVIEWIGAAEHKPAMLLSASAIGYYGVQKPGNAAQLTEDDPAQPVFMSDLCPEWENAAQAASRHGVAVMCMRLGVVLGNQGALPMMLLPVRLGLGGPLAGGAQWLSWIHVDDVIGAMAHLCRAGQAGVYNLTAPHSVTQQQFSHAAAQVLGRPCAVPTPGWPLRLALGEQADLLLGGQRVAPARLVASGFKFAYPELSPALRSLM